MSLDYEIQLDARAAPASRTTSPALAAAQRSAHADRGAYAEARVAEALKSWVRGGPGREANRLLDTRAAKRIVRSAPADFEFFCVSPACHGLIEVKSTVHEYRLAHDKVPQLPSLRQRAGCGGLCAVLVYHSTSKVWRSASVRWLVLALGGASWDLTPLDTYPTARAALQGVFPTVFAA